MLSSRFGPNFSVAPVLAGAVDSSDDTMPDEIEVKNLGEAIVLLKVVARAVRALADDVHSLSKNVVTTSQLDAFKSDVDSRFDSLRAEIKNGAVSNTLNRWLDSVVKFMSVMTMLIVIGGGIATAVLFFNRIPH